MHVLSLLASTSLGMCTHYVQPLQILRYVHISASKLPFEVKAFYFDNVSIFMISVFPNLEHGITYKQIESNFIFVEHLWSSEQWLGNTGTDR